MPCRPVRGRVTVPPALDTTATQPEQPAGAFDPTAPGAKGLKPDAIGYVSNLVIAIASTAPAYSLAATLGFIVAVTGVGVHAPAVLIVSFIPILFVSVGYRFFNLADPDAGTTFAWVTRAFGPQIGWVNGWAIFLADIIVMASLAAIASSYTYSLWNGHAVQLRPDRRRGHLDRADDVDLLPRHRAVGTRSRRSCSASRSSRSRCSRSSR